MKINRNTIGRWRQRFFSCLNGLHDEPRPVAPRLITDEKVERVVVATRGEALGRNALEHARHGRAFWAEPLLDRSRLACLRPSTAPIERLSAFERSALHQEGAGHRCLYLDPPESAVVLCVDEKSQVQALSRMQPVLPMMARAPRSNRTHTFAAEPHRCCRARRRDWTGLTVSPPASLDGVHQNSCRRSATVCRRISTFT